MEIGETAARGSGMDPTCSMIPTTVANTRDVHTRKSHQGLLRPAVPIGYRHDLRSWNGSLRGLMKH